MSVAIFMEGGSVGPGSGAKNTECRKGLHQLLKKCGFAGRLPVVYACGGRADAFREFKNELRGNKRFEFAILWVDSEDPVADVEKTWAQLRARPGDNWTRPKGATDDQVLLMTTCMETLIAADRKTLLRVAGRTS